MINYESQSNSANPEATSLLRGYRSASLALGAAEAKLSYLEKHHALINQLPGAEAARSAAQVKLKAISDAYVSAVTSQAPRSGLVSLVAGASNRRQQPQIKGRDARLHRSFARHDLRLRSSPFLRERRRAGKGGGVSGEQEQSPQPS